MKDVAAMIRNHFDSIVAWARSRQTSGFIEALNGLFQAAKRKARGYTRFQTMKTVLFLIAGKLNFSRSHLIRRSFRLRRDRLPHFRLLSP
jgi:hypothetical protein